MKYYTIYAETYHNGKLIGIQCGGTCLTEKELPKEETFVLTWDNLSEMQQKLNCMCDFNIWNFKKGRMISFFDCKMFDKNTWDIKEWKEEKLNIEIKVYNKEIDKQSIFFLVILFMYTISCIHNTIYCIHNTVYCIQDIQYCILYTVYCIQFYFYRIF